MGSHRTAPCIYLCLSLSTASAAAKGGREGRREGGEEGGRTTKTGRMKGERERERVAKHLKMKRSSTSAQLLLCLFFISFLRWHHFESGNISWLNLSDSISQTSNQSLPSVCVCLWITFFSKQLIKLKSLAASLEKHLSSRFSFGSWGEKDNGWTQGRQAAFLQRLLTKPFFTYHTIPEVERPFQADQQFSSQN